MAAAAVIGLWCAYLVRDALLVIYISGLLAMGFSPLVRIIERQRVLPIGAARFPRWFAILVPYVAFIGVFGLVLAVLWPPIVDQAQALWTALPDMFDRVQRFLVGKGLLREHLTLREAMERAQGGSTVAVGKLAGAVAGVAGGIFVVLTILVLSFYILVDAENLRVGLLRLFPPRSRERAAAASRAVTTKVSAWLVGQVLLGATIGTTSAIGLWALGIPYFYVLALLTGIGELIPVIGPVLSAIPALAVAATISLEKTLLVLIFLIAQQQLESQVLVPRIMSRQLGVSPVAVFVALLIGGSLLGIVGAILAIPTAAIVQVVANELLGES